MSTRSKKKAKQVEKDIDAILRRVDRMPILDSRTPDEILGYDESGMPGSPTFPTDVTPAQDAPDSEEDPDMADWRKTFGHQIPPAVKEFLEYRHREWELAMEVDLKARQEAGAKRKRKP